MTNKEIINEIAGELTGIAECDLTHAESKIVNILIEANVLKYEDKYDETLVSWVKK